MSDSPPSYNRLPFTESALDQLIELTVEHHYSCSCDDCHDLYGYFVSHGSSTKLKYCECKQCMPNPPSYEEH